jgi:hypothetical protein
LVPGPIRWDELTDAEPVPTDISGVLLASSRLAGADGRMLLAL